ncbi:MAG: hypothetical protein K0U38_08335 [Epsilonproteobacteria bacterium]|nr:hypothetical protein [Campylobacterota bacterium]
MKKDIISKELLKEMAKDISRHILHIEILDDMELIDNEFTRVERRDADLVYKNGNEIVHIEIQNNHHPKMHLRMLRYYDDILFQYEKYSVKQYLLYVGKEKCYMKDEIVRDEINYRYVIIDIRDVSCEAFLKSADPSAVVLAILCNFEGKDKQMVVNTILKRLIELADDEVSFRNYLEKVEIFSTNRNLEKYVDKGEEMLAVDIEKLPSFNRGLEKGIEKVAVGLLKINMDIGIIQKTTGLSLEKIEELKRGLKEEER